MTSRAHSRAAGRPILFAMSAERDPYVRHHRTFGGTAYVWLEAPDDREGVERLSDDLEGVEAVLTRHQAAERFRLHPERIGDLVVLGDRTPSSARSTRPVEDLPAGFRTHGSCTSSACRWSSTVSRWPRRSRVAHTHNVHLTRSLPLEG